ncbi:hypothetical protein OUZ56_001702 [Daphnia magna]|uniref:Uncharacterized protein n=1 Tax=Daphnia magna TaxID=35525 RepID=A0ABR0A400_9CRUS|nr:hypothetical protein OUZ56_001702 [Daphnia magna]
MEGCDVSRKLLFHARRSEGTDRSSLNNVVDENFVSVLMDDGSTSSTGLISLSVNKILSVRLFAYGALLLPELTQNLVLVLLWIYRWCPTAVGVIRVAINDETIVSVLMDDGSTSSTGLILLSDNEICSRNSLVGTKSGESVMHPEKLCDFFVESNSSVNSAMADLEIFIASLGMFRILHKLECLCHKTARLTRKPITQSKSAFNLDYAV